MSFKLSCSELQLKRSMHAVYIITCTAVLMKMESEGSFLSFLDKEQRLWLFFLRCLSVPLPSRDHTTIQKMLSGLLLNA